jgi:hypothetical protein
MNKITAEELDSFTIGEGLDIPDFNDDQHDDELAIMAAQIQAPKSEREILLERLTPQELTEMKNIWETTSQGAKNLEQARLTYVSDLEKKADGKASPEIMEDKFVKNIKKVLKDAKKGAKEAKKGGKRRKTKKRRKSRKRKTKKRKRRKKRKTKKRRKR